MREGFALHQAGDLIAAERYYRRALKRDKKNADALFLLGSVQVQTGDLEEAETTLRAALAIQPERSETLYNLARVMMDTGRFGDAESLLEKAVVSQPDHPSFLRNLGVVRLNLGKPAAAADVLSRAANVDPSSAEAWCDLGMALSQCDENARSTDAFNQALNLEADHPRARHNRGHLYLKQKIFEQGWTDYAYRQTDPQAGFDQRAFDFPVWPGVSVKDGALLVWGEQGLGDQILHASMFSDLKDKVNHLIVECEPRLVPLFRRSFPDVTIVPASLPPRPEIVSANPKFQIPSGSLGQWLRPSVESFQQPYSFPKADKDKVKQIKNELDDRYGDKPRIGVAWKSARAEFGGHKSSDISSDWATILETGGDVTYLSLQYGNTKPDLDRCNETLGVVIYDDLDVDVTKDIDGLAALIVSLDLVITTSNTTAHVAGALGVPTWVLIPRGPAHLWYWFDGETRSLWYPSARLYWQTTAGDWRDPAKRLAQDLKSWLQDQRNGLSS